MSKPNFIVCETIKYGTQWQYATKTKIQLQTKQL